MLVRGIAYWAFLDRPKVSKEYNENYYQLTLQVDDKNAKILSNEGIKIKIADPNKNGFEGKFAVFKTNAKNKKGEDMSPPPVVDKHKAPINDSIVGNGSEVFVSFVPYPWKRGNDSGVMAILNAVQVIKLVEYTPSGVSEFENFDDQLADF